MLQRIGALLGGATVWVGAGAQTHKVAKPETVVRAVAVYEWTGDLAKPAASRLVPVTLFIDRHLEDAGIYLARPLPFALLPGDIYELEQSGVPKGNVELVYARHLQAANTAEAYDDGWFGYGSYKPLPAPKKPIARKPGATLAKVETSGGSASADKPHFSGNTADTASAKPSDAKPGADDKTADKIDAKTDANADPDRPTMKRRNTDDTASATAASAGSTADTTTTTSASSDKTSTPADDPDRPTMKRRNTDDAASTTGTATGSTTAADKSPAPADDPDRPTLKRHSAEDAKKAAKGQSQASVSGSGGLLADDPNRPTLHRGKPTGALTETDLPKLSGLPVDLQQMVAVSDAADRPVHDFTRPWDDDAERAAVLGKMRSMAQAQLAAYGAPVAPAPVAAARAAGAPSAPVRKPDSKRRSLAPVPVSPTELVDEKLTGYLLSYGDVPTFVYQAHTQGTGADLRYVTLVAQRDAQGEPVLALHTVTDATHLDRTPRLRLVDAVDVEASNRASLLFEMRGETSRQFGVYRVLGQHADQLFATGTTQ